MEFGVWSLEFFFFLLFFFFSSSWSIIVGSTMNFTQGQLTDKIKR